ncbi:hypothetical protein Bca4012_052678 [Brassica carinata]
MPIHKARGNGESAQQASLGARLCQLTPPKSRLSWRPTRPHQEIKHQFTLQRRPRANSRGRGTKHDRLHEYSHCTLHPARGSAESDKRAAGRHRHGPRTPNRCYCIRKQLFNTDRVTRDDEHPADDAPGDDARSQSNADPATVSEIAELKLSLQNIHSKLHHVTSSAPLIDSVLGATLKTPLTQRMSDIHLKSEKFRLPSYSGTTDPSDHMTAFNIAMGRANLTEH